MKRTLLLIIASLSLGLTAVGCGSKSSGGNASTPDPTDPGAHGGFQCEAWQIYTTQYGCLNPGPCGSIGPNYGYNPADGRCYPGITATNIPTGTWDNSITVTNISQFQKMLRDMNRCYQSTCPSANWAYLSLQVFDGAYYGSGGSDGWQNYVPGYNQSSSYHTQHGYHGGPQSRYAQVNLRTAGGYYGYGSNIQFSSSAYPTQNGFKMIVYGISHTPAYDERIEFIFTYLNAERSQLRVKIKYQDQIVAEGDINRL